jgi:hypothetical protein
MFDGDGAAPASLDQVADLTFHGGRVPASRRGGWCVLAELVVCARPGQSVPGPEILVEGSSGPQVLVRVIDLRRYAIPLDELAEALESYARVNAGLLS